VEIVRAEQREQLVFRWCGHNFKYDAMGLARAEGIPGEESE
jgi:hypothetical protein